MSSLLAPEEVISRVRHFYELLARGDETALAGFLADDAALHNPVGFPPLEGRERAMELFRRLRRHVQDFDLRMEPLLILPGGNEAAVRLSVTLTRGGEQHQLERIDTFRLDGHGRIAEMRFYWDLPGALRELLS